MRKKNEGNKPAPEEDENGAETDEGGELSVVEEGADATEKEPSLADRHFTVDEVNVLIPHMEAIFDRIGELYEEAQSLLNELNAQGETLEGEETDDTPDDIKERRARVRELAEAIQEGVDELEEPGGSVKDLSTGLVDFLSRRDGRTVYLCWRRGETECGWWHDLDSGYQGRRPIAEAGEFEGTYVH